MIDVANYTVIGCLIALGIALILMVLITIFKLTGKIKRGSTYVIGLVSSIILIVFSGAILALTTLSGKGEDTYSKLATEGYVTKKYVNLTDFTLVKHGDGKTYVSTTVGGTKYELPSTKKVLIDSVDVAQDRTKVLIEETSLTKDVPNPLRLVLKLLGRSGNKGNVIDIKLQSLTKGSDYPK